MIILQVKAEFINGESGLLLLFSLGVERLSENVER